MWKHIKARAIKHNYELQDFYVSETSNDLNDYLLIDYFSKTWLKKTNSCSDHSETLNRIKETQVHSEAIELTRET